MSAIIVYILAALIAGGSGFAFSYFFNKSNYVTTNFGTPNRGYFALICGVLVSTLSMTLLSELVRFPPDSIGVTFLIAIIIGGIGGVAGMFMGRKNREKK